MSKTDFPTINDVVEFLGLEKDPRFRNPDIYNVHCPFCQHTGDKKYKMNINNIKGVYNCPRCSDGGREGTLDLYARVRHNTRCIKGVNSKELSHMLMEDLNWNGDSGYVGHKAEKNSGSISKEILPEYKGITPAEDYVLDRVYNAVLDLPYMALSKKHMSNLIKRGLDFSAIKRNRYRTVLKPAEWVKTHPQYEHIMQFMESDGYKQYMSRNAQAQRMNREYLLAGLLIGEDLSRNKICLDRIPGFFRIQDKWCFRVYPGLLIPTRNMQGQIVAFQIRLDEAETDGLRYLTVSCKEFEGAPNEQITRIHFPLVNTEPGMKKVPVLLTEGPLKADVAAHLFGTPSFFMAVPGVNNLREIPDTVKALSEKGVRHALCAYDMDRISNVYVYRAEKKAREMFNAGGIILHEYQWQKKLIRNYEEHIHQFYIENGWTDAWKEQSTSLDTVLAAMDGLRKFNNELYLKFRSENKWNGYKGIDDYLLAKRNIGI